MDECICFVTPEHTWFRYGSAVEPGSQNGVEPRLPGASARHETPGYQHYPAN